MMEARERLTIRHVGRSGILRDISWSPTIALSWLWGLGFFFSFHMVLTYGWLGFAMFAVPNAFGLFAFGWILGDERRDPATLFKQLQTRFLGLFLSSQVLAVAITVFATVDYLLIPLFGFRSLAGLAILVILSMAVGHAASMRGLKLLHIAYLGVGLAAAVSLLAILLAHGSERDVPFAAFDSRFYSLIVPSLVGFLLGPWTDVQHWQRAIAIRAEGGSVRRAYVGGAGLFLGMIVLNALIAGAAGPALIVISSDGLPGLQAAVAGAVAKIGFGPPVIAYLLWAAAAVASTLDSFYLATRWLLRATTAASTSPLLAFVPSGLVTTPVWYLGAAILIAILAVAENVAMIFLMIAYATLFVGAATNLVCEVITGRRHYDSVLCTLIGLASLLIFAVGYLDAAPELVALAPAIGMVGAIPALRDVLTSKRDAPLTAAAPPAELRKAVVDLAPPTASAGVASVRSHGFEGQWFVMRFVPTYDDTNSMGNIYFANYFRWVGKARELMFNDCMPAFDLAKTDFYILTKDFSHEFRREIKEFEPVEVRLRIVTVNRKFVTIVHEIQCGAGLVGRGEQTLMFVDSGKHKPLDVPATVLTAFLPYYEKVTGPRLKTAQ